MPVQEFYGSTYEELAPCKTPANETVVAHDRASCETTGSTWTTPCEVAVCSGNDDGTAAHAVCEPPPCDAAGCTLLDSDLIAAVEALGAEGGWTNCTAAPSATAETAAAVAALVDGTAHPSEAECAEAGGVYSRLRHSRAFEERCLGAGGLYRFDPVPCTLNAAATACGAAGADCAFRRFFLPEVDPTNENVSACMAHVPELPLGAGYEATADVKLDAATGIYSTVYNETMSHAGGTDAELEASLQAAPMAELQQKAAVAGVMEERLAYALARGGDAAHAAVVELVLSAVAAAAAAGLGFLDQYGSAAALPRALAVQMRPRWH
jgi:hypothetical protein